MQSPGSLQDNVLSRMLKKVNAFPNCFVASSLHLHFVFLTDVDECIDGMPQGPCDPNATCANTAGSFTCTCNFGYRGDGFNCVGKVPSLLLRSLLLYCHTSDYDDYHQVKLTW